MHLQYSEQNAAPRVILGVEEIIIFDKHMVVHHSDSLIECNIVFHEEAVIYLESDDEIYTKVCNKDGRINCLDDLNKNCISIKKDSIIINGKIITNHFSIHIEN